jgi:chaperonin GroES
MKFKPIGDRVVIKRKEVEEQTKSGIYLPESARKDSFQGTIVAVGTSPNIPVKVGDKIVYEKFVGNELEIDGDKLIIMEVKDIIGILED